MNIHIVTHQHSDGNVRLLTEGWLSHPIRDLRVRVSGGQGYMEPAADFWQTLPQADAIVLAVTSGPASAELPRAIELIEEHGKWGHTVLLDYHDSARKWPYEGVARRVRTAFIGRRYLYERLEDTLPNPVWWPRLGIERRVLRYAGALPWPVWKDKDAACFYRIYDKAAHRAPWMALAGRLGAMTGTATHGLRHPLYERTAGFRHCPNYYELVSRARIGVHLMGGNTAMGYQFWEYAALGCAILAQHPSLHPSADIEKAEWEYLGLKEGSEFEYFRTEAEFVAKYRAMARDPRRCESMAARVTALVAPYRSVERAAALYDHLAYCAGE